MAEMFKRLVVSPGTKWALMGMMPLIAGIVLELTGGTNYPFLGPLGMIAVGTVFEINGIRLLLLAKSRR